MIQVFIGYDTREKATFTVCSHSILARASQPVSITPIMLSQLGHIFDRPRHSLQSTEFSFSRFLTPYLSKFEGWSLFMDGDMVVLEDICNLWNLRDENYAVQVVKHKHEPIETKKFLDQPQSKYEKKNWSSVMLFNNAKCKALSPEYVNSASGLELHQFKWLESDKLIGELPLKWNYLADYNKEAVQPALIHYTKGGPYFNNYEDCQFADIWWQEQRDAMHVEQKTK